MSTHAFDPQRYFVASQDWIKLVQDRTNGAVQVETFASGSLYQPTTVGDALISGEIDMALTTPGTFPKQVPANALDWLDFAGPDVTQGWAKLHTLVSDPVVMNALDAKFQSIGVKLLYFVPNCVMQGPLSVKAPVTSMADLKGMIVYTPSTTVSKYIEALGGTTVFVPTGDVPAALQRGTFNAALSLNEMYMAFKLYENAKYITDYTFTAGLMPYFISLKTWDNLPADVQDVMLTASTEIQDQYFASQAAYDTGMWKGLSSKVTVTELSPEEKTNWDAAVNKFHVGYAQTDDLTKQIWQRWTEIKAGQ